MMRLPTKICLGAAILAGLAACDMEPDPDFQQKFENGRLAQSGGQDQHTDLVFKNTHADYMRITGLSSALAESVLTSTIQRISNSVPAAMELLASWEYAPDNVEAVSGCTDLIDEALSSSEAINDTAYATALFESLETCHEQAVKQQGRASSASDEEYYLVLRRSSSAAMLYLGTSLVMAGKKEDGHALWQRASRIADSDAPGYQLKARDLLPR